MVASTYRVIKEITNLIESKASPIESIPAKILKGNLDILAPKILSDFNLSIDTGIFPQISISKVTFDLLVYYQLCPQFQKN